MPIRCRAGVDYAYTLQGWLKGVNSNKLNEEADIGQDGLTGTDNESFAKDAYGYTLNYYADDYRVIDGTRWLDQDKRFEAYHVGSEVMANRKDLFNGNITMMATTIAEPLAANTDLLNPLPQANAYDYDQLNRRSHAQSQDSAQAQSSLAEMP